MSNLSISSTNDMTEWVNFLKKSLNKNIFSHPFYLENLGEDFEKFFVKKDKEIFASFFLKKESDKIKLSNQIIYTPVIFKNFINKPLSSLNTTKLEIINEIKNFFAKNFSKVDFISDYHFNDLRPFFWHNFDLKKKIFKVIDLKYTTTVNLETINNLEN